MQWVPGWVERPVQWVPGWVERPVQWVPGWESVLVGPVQWADQYELVVAEKPFCMTSDANQNILRKGSVSEARNTDMFPTTRIA